MALTIEQKRAIAGVLEGIVDAVKVAGPMGAPGGVLYAAMMGHMSYQTFETVMGALVQAGKVSRRGQCYFAD
jgi:hypothetical protein